MTEQEYKEFLEWAFGHFNESAYNSLGRPVLVPDKENPRVVWTPYGLDPDDSTYASYSYNYYKWRKEQEKKEKEQEERERQERERLER